MWVSSPIGRSESLTKAISQWKEVGFPCNNRTLSGLLLYRVPFNIMVGSSFPSRYGSLVCHLACLFKPTTNSQSQWALFVRRPPSIAILQVADTYSGPCSLDYLAVSQMEFEGAIQH